MREMLIKFIIERYKNGYDEVFRYIGEIEPGEQMSLVQYNVEMKRYNDMQEGKISIEDWLKPLTDCQLIGVYDSQCCQMYR